MISPTGLGIRSDAAGDGHFGAPRGDNTHKGVDFLTLPGQPVIMPISFGRIKRVAWPYKVNGDYRGIEIEGYDRGAGDVVIKMFYLVPFQLGSAIAEGTVIGYAQDISVKYGGDPMQPHIHLEFRKDGKLIDPEKLLKKEV
jgi:hypothetical protein